jgi:hypothetical protein
MEKEIKGLIGRGELDADVVFLNKYLHIDCIKLRQALQASLLKHRDKDPVVIYGDICLGFNGEMNKLVEECGATKVNALNCTDCMPGGSGRLLEILKAISLINEKSGGIGRWVSSFRAPSR